MVATVFGFDGLNSFSSALSFREWPCRNDKRGLKLPCDPALLALDHGAALANARLRLLAPKIPESRRRQLRVAHRVLNVLVPEIGLQGARVVPLVRQRVAAGVPEHVRVRLKTKPRLGARAFDHAGEASGREWRSTF